MPQCSSHKLWAVIPAAGQGQRFSATELKQYQTILGQTVLAHSVAALNSLPLEGYVLAISENDTLAKKLKLSHPDKAHFCFGGRERVDSVLAALQYLSQFANPNDWVMVHDAARPCVSAACLKKLYDHAIQANSAAILATPVRDTLKRGFASSIAHTVSRDDLWQAQTPQMARLGQLKTAIERALQQHKKLTDEASALEAIDENVLLVTGRQDNFKITYPEDLALAELILKSRQD